MELVLTNCVQIAPQKTNPEITITQLQGKMKVWREGTTTSPSGRHLGHYKSLFTVIDNSLESDDCKELKEIQERIAGCYVAILNYAIRHNYSYKRWKQILNFMIYKEQGYQHKQSIEYKSRSHGKLCRNTTKMLNSSER